VIAPDTPAPLWPGVNAGLNAVATVLIVVGLVAVKRGAIGWHKACMTAAFAVSAAFLASYLGYHATSPSVPYPPDGPARGAYLAMLLSHILLALGVAVLVPVTVWWGWTGRLPRHRRWARITAPIWLYVSVTGVAVYVWLYHVAGARPVP